MNGEGAQNAPAQALRPLERPLVMPDVFHGRAGEDFDVWLDNFDVSAAINRWDDPMCRQIMIVRLRGAAQRLIQGLAPAVRNDYQQLRAALRQRFLPPERTTLHRAELRGRRRRTDESLTSLADDITILTARAYPEAGEPAQPMLTQIALDSFLDALDDSLRRRVRESEPANLAAALRRALTLESLDQSERGRTSSMATAPVPVQAVAAASPTSTGIDRLELVAQQFERIASTFAATVDRLAMVDARTPPAMPRGRGRPVVCFNCRETGHLVRDCPHLPSRQASATSRQALN